MGIDAANSEIFARPEVFAQAFRYLRESTCEVCGADVLSDLGMTYHVGEDYLDVVDGLRAVDELIHYMQFRNGDRLGHAMVLGIDANAYYSRAHYNIILPKQVLLDNIVWLYYKGKNLQDFVPICHTLETLFENTAMNYMVICSFVQLCGTITNHGFFVATIRSAIFIKKRLIGIRLVRDGGCTILTMCR